MKFVARVAMWEHVVEHTDSATVVDAIMFAIMQIPVRCVKVARS